MRLAKQAIRQMRLAKQAIRHTNLVSLGYWFRIVFRRISSQRSSTPASAFAARRAGSAAATAVISNTPITTISIELG
jgi:hypothetical protein